MPMTTGGYANLFDKRFKKIFFDEYMRQPEEYKKIAKISTESTHYVQEGDYVGLGAMQEMHENQAIPMDEFEEGNTKRTYFTNFGLGLQISRNLFDDDQFSVMNKGIAELGKSAAYTRELKFWDVLNSSELPAVRAGLDGLELCSLIHPVQGVPGDTLSNIVNAGLSKSSLESAIDLMEGMVNEKGIPVVMRPKILVIPYQLKWKAKELMESVLDPESANNTINPLKGEGIRFMVSHYLTSSTACYLLSDDHDLRFMWRKAAEFKSKDDFNTDAALFKGTMRFQSTFFQWRGVVKIDSA